MQQNQVKTGQCIFAPTKEYPVRLFYLKNKVSTCVFGQMFFGTAQYYGINSNQDFALKFYNKTQVKQEEIDFIKSLISYQNSQFETNFPCSMIRVFDIFEYNEYFVTIMEKGEQDLYNYLKNTRSRITLAEKYQICLDVVLPVYFLHQNGLVHRNIKAENYVKVGNKFKLIDFGYVKKLDGNMTERNVSGCLFEAPEMIDYSQSYTNKVDIWALGCLFHEIFHEDTLFLAKDNFELKNLIKNTLTDTTYILNKIDVLQCDLFVKFLMVKMLQPDQNKRIDAQNLIRELNQIKIFDEKKTFKIYNQNQQQSYGQKLNNETQNPFEERLKQLEDKFNLKLQNLEAKLNENMVQFKIEQYDRKKQIQINQGNLKQDFQEEFFKESLSNDFNNQKEIEQQQNSAFLFQEYCIKKPQEQLVDQINKNSIQQELYVSCTLSQAFEQQQEQLENQKNKSPTLQQLQVFEDQNSLSENSVSYILIPHSHLSQYCNQENLNAEQEQKSISQNEETQKYNDDLKEKVREKQTPTTDCLQSDVQKEFDEQIEKYKIELELKQSFIIKLQRDNQELKEQFKQQEIQFITYLDQKKNQKDELQNQTVQLKNELIQTKQIPSLANRLLKELENLTNDERQQIFLENQEIFEKLHDMQNMF